MMAALGLTSCVQGVVLVYHSTTWSIAPIVQTGLSVQPKPYPIQCGSHGDAVVDSCKLDGNTGSCSSKGYTAHIHALEFSDCNGRAQRPSDGRFHSLNPEEQREKD